MQDPYIEREQEDLIHEVELHDQQMVAQNVASESEKETEEIPKFDEGRTVELKRPRLQ